ncbi:glycosyltransferase [Paenibacillus melissococcoides]
MKWAMLLGSPDISGGTYVIFEHAIRAKRRGIDVTLVTEEPVDMERLHWHPEATELSWRTYSEASEDLFDICIATWWRTVYELHRVQAKTYAYFVQSIESRFYSESEKPLRQLVESTYALPLHIITEAKWIKDYLKEHFNKEAYLVLNGIRKDIYFEDGEKHADRKKDKLRVLVEGPIDVDFKNVPKTIELCKQSNADEIWLLTSSPITSYPGVDRVFSRVPIFKTPEIYRSCDVIIKLSYVEGMFGPPLEMFHCGGTSITYDVTGHDEYIVDGQNGIVIACDNDTEVVKSINELKEDRIYLNQLLTNAKKTASEWPSWEESSSQFQTAIINIINNDRHISNIEVKNYSNFMFGWYIIAENYKNDKSRRVSSTMLPKIKSILKRRSPRLFDLLRKTKFYLITKKHK